MADYMFRMPDAMKAELEAKAKAKGITLKEMLMEYINLSYNIDERMTDKSMLLIKDPKDLDGQAIMMPYPLQLKNKQVKSA